MFSSITHDSNILQVKINNKYVLGVQMYAKIIN